MEFNSFLERTESKHGCWSISQCFSSKRLNFNICWVTIVSYKMREAYFSISKDRDLQFWQCHRHRQPQPHNTYLSTLLQDIKAWYKWVYKQLCFACKNIVGLVVLSKMPFQKCLIYLTDHHQWRCSKTCGLSHSVPVGEVDPWKFDHLCKATTTAEVCLTCSKFTWIVISPKNTHIFHHYLLHCQEMGFLWKFSS